MIGAISAILASVFFGIAIILVRRVLEKISYLSAVIFVTIVGNIIFWPIVLLIVPLDSLNPIGIMYFIFAGVLHPGLGRILYYKGIETLGAPLNTSLIAIYPLFTTVFAIGLLDERPTVGILMGICCIIVGIFLIEKNTSLFNPNSERRIGKKLLYPIIAAIFIGVANVLRKLGLLEYNQVPMGVAVGSLVSLGVYSLLIFSSKTTRDSISFKKEASILAVGAGLALSGAWFFNFYALSLEEAIAVSSLRSSTPLLVLILSHFFLKKFERLSGVLFVLLS
jgi:drug/metabolite transporter (DMT)-like permease